MPWAKVRPIINPEVRKLCFRAYPNHPKGCPNYGKKDGCPPTAPLIHETLDLDETWAVWNVFPLGKHVEAMLTKHPKWSQRQLECCLYWQPKARKQLAGIVTDHLREVWIGKKPVVVKCPEAQGVDLTSTLRRVGVELEWPPRTNAVQVVLVGRPHEN